MARQVQVCSGSDIGGFPSSNALARYVTFSDLSGSTAVVRGRRVEGTTKGGRSRTISIDSETVTVLREHRRQQAEKRLAPPIGGTVVAGALPRASDTIVSVRPGEAVALAQDRSFIATVGDRTGMLRSGQGHAADFARP
jgi:hypothetical protein